MKFTRREFFKTAFSGFVSLFLVKRKSFSKNLKIPYRKLNGIGKEVTVIGFGSTKRLTPDIVEYAIDSGINYIDTAHSYQRGRSEEIIGKVMKKKRDRVFLVTKLDPASWRKKDQKKAFHESLNESLKRLQTDHVDAILAHNSNEVERFSRPELYEFFNEAKKQGKVSYLGLSFHRNWEEVLPEVLKHNEIQLILFPFWAAIDPKGYELLMAAHKKGIALVGMKAHRSFFNFHLDGWKESEYNEENPWRSKFSEKYELNAAKVALKFKEMSCLLVSMTTYDRVDKFILEASKPYTGSFDKEAVPEHLKFILE